MSNGVTFEVKFFGWFNDPDKNSDKVWGYVEIEGKLYNFWGRRDNAGDGKSLKFKRHNGTGAKWDLMDLTRAKRNKGYKAVDCTKDNEGRCKAIEDVYPNFTAHMKKQLMFARITGTVRNEEV